MIDRQRHELRRRREAHPDQADITRRAQAPDPRLWERRPDDDDFLDLTAGYGEVPFRPALARTMTPAEQAEEVLAAHALARARAGPGASSATGAWSASSESASMRSRWPARSSARPPFCTVRPT